MQLAGFKFDISAEKLLPNLVQKTLLHGGFHIKSVVSVKAMKGAVILLEGGACERPAVETAVTQCQAILDGGLDLHKVVEMIPPLLETVGIDGHVAKWAALEPAVGRVWAVIGLGSSPILKNINKFWKHQRTQNAAAMARAEAEEQAAKRISFIRSPGTAPRREATQEKPVLDSSCLGHVLLKSAAITIVPPVYSKITQLCAQHNLLVCFQAVRFVPCQASLRRRPRALCPGQSLQRTRRARWPLRRWVGPTVVCTVAVLLRGLAGAGAGSGAGAGAGAGAAAAGAGAGAGADGTAGAGAGGSASWIPSCCCAAF
jgi:hypothetical protein